MESWGSRTKSAKFAVVSTAVLSTLLLFTGLGDTGKRKGQTGALTGEAGSARSKLAGVRNAAKRFEAYGKLPLSFEENRGQTAREVRYVSRGSGYELFLTPQEAVLALRGAVPHDFSPRNRFATLRALREARRANRITAIHLRLDGANPGPQISGTDLLPGKVNYFIGNDPKKWHTDVPTYARVKYAAVYPGVDLVFYGNQRRLEYDFVVAPGADPKAIRLKLEGADRLRLNAQGDLIASVPGGEVELQKPIVYQILKGERREIAGSYELAKAHEVRFFVPSYDRSEALVLDPVLNYSTYLGGSADEDGAAIAVDANGNAFIAGTSSSTDFPTTSTAFTPQPLPANGVSGATAAFVTEINPAGTQLLYSTYLAGSTPAEAALGIAVDAAGKIYVTGQTASSDFPTNSTITPLKQGPNPTNAGTSFLTKLDPAALTGAASLVYSSYIGGPNGDFGNGVAADANGNAYVTGLTFSPPGTGTNINNLADFPVTANAIQSALSNPNGNAFLTRIDTTQSGNNSLIYSTYLGGNGANAATLGFGDAAFGVAVDTSSNAYLIGATSSDDFPTTANAFQQNTSPPAAVANGTAFIARIDTTAGSLVYSSYLGGENFDFGTAIALGPNNLAYVTGTTSSLAFPTTTGAFQETTPNAAGRAFVSLIDTGQINSAPPTYSTYLGGTNIDTGNSIRTDTLGNAYVDGSTVSTDFPVTQGAFQPQYPGAQSDGFVTKLNPGGNGSADLIYSTFIGGSGAGHDQAEGIALDTSNNVYITGQTVSSDLPVFPNPGAFQTSLSGPSDAFIVKLTLIPSLAVSPLSLDFGTQPTGVTSTAKTVTLTNNTSDPIPFPGSSISFSGNNPADFASPSNTCGTSIAAGASCTVSVTFTPSVASGESATLVITVMITEGGVTSSQAFNVSLTGTGSNAAPGVMLAPTSLGFGGQLLTTTSSAKPVTLTNNGTAPLTIISIAASADFAETSTGSSACPVSPQTLAAGANCTINVTFAPTAVGSRSGTLTISDNAGGTPHTVPLTGTGWDFNVNAPSTVAVKAGKSVTFTVTMTPLGGFTQAVTVACSGTPALATCTPAPASVAAADGVTAQTSSVTVTTTALMVPPPPRPLPPFSIRQVVLLVVAGILLLLLLSARRPRARLGLATAMLIFAILAGCSGPKAPGTPLGTTNLTITCSSTGSAGTVTKPPLTVALTVN